MAQQLVEHHGRLDGVRLRDEDVLRPFARGCMRTVRRGLYTAGPRKGQRCVVKYFHRALNEGRALRDDMKVLGMTRALIRKFNRQHVIRQRVSLNSVELKEHKRRKVLVEPYLPGYQKWNSNSGWTDTSSSWGQVMQALSHYSFHASRGTLLLCDLQGAVYGRSVVVSDPAICSRAKEYGMTDMGAEGIANFFATHRCNRFCSERWIKPLRRQESHRPPGKPTMYYRHYRH